ncbi:MAG: DNA adenine methylase [Eubacteriales bacterium]|nr:DNA adenine methylase [Eubacteriales bacterium]
MKYGFSYRGSKSDIAEKIINILPKAKNLYDLFAGGCAITHCAMLSEKWDRVIANDLQGSVTLFLDAIKGKYKNESRWISREQFLAEKDKDNYIRWICSFGNNGQDYMFGKDIEQIKKEAHEYLFVNGYDGTQYSRIALVKRFKEDKDITGRFELQQLEKLERLQQLEKLERLQQLEQLTVYSEDYRDVKIEENSVVYCDIPYNQKTVKTEKYYGIEFDKKSFYEWAKNANFPVYFSSSFCDDSFFTEVFSVKKECRMNNKNSHGKKIITERLFYNRYTKEEGK